MSDAPSRSRQRLLLALKLLVAAAALTWTLTRAPVPALLASARRMSLLTMGLGFGLSALNLGLAALRSRVVLRAYDAKAPPSLATLVRLQWIGVFYNTALPGNVGGDLVRAHAMRDAFAGAPNAFVTVLIERVFGLAGLLTLSASILALRPVPGVEGLSRLAALGVFAALLAAVSPLVGRRVGRALGPDRDGPVGRLARLLSNLPEVGHPGLLALAFGLSIATQALVAATGFALVHAVAPGVPAAGVLALVPVAQVATYFPATVAGLGVREAAFVVLLSHTGVPQADATVASLCMLTLQLSVAFVGGILHVTAPARPDRGYEGP